MPCSGFQFSIHKSNYETGNDINQVMILPELNLDGLEDEEKDAGGKDGKSKKSKKTKKDKKSRKKDKKGENGKEKEEETGIIIKKIDDLPKTYIKVIPPTNESQIISTQKLLKVKLGTIQDSLKAIFEKGGQEKVEEIVQESEKTDKKSKKKKNKKKSKKGKKQKEEKEETKNPPKKSTPTPKEYLTNSLPTILEDSVPGIDLRTTSHFLPDQPFFMNVQQILSSSFISPMACIVTVISPSQNIQYVGNDNLAVFCNHSKDSSFFMQAYKKESKLNSKLSLQASSSIPQDSFFVIQLRELDFDEQLHSKLQKNVVSFLPFYSSEQCMTNGHFNLPLWEVKGNIDFKKLLKKGVKNPWGLFQKMASLGAGSGDFEGVSLSLESSILVTFKDFNLQVNIQLRGV